MITGYLAGTRQRFLEFGGFSERDPESISPMLQYHAEWMAERAEPGLTSWVAFLVDPADDRVAGLLDELAGMARSLAGTARTDVLALLVVVVSRPVTRQQYDRWQQGKFNVGPVRVVPWVVDLARNQLFPHEGLPMGIDPDLALLVAPEPPPEPVHVQYTAEAPRRRGPRLPEFWLTLSLLAVLGAVWVAMTIAGGSLEATKDTELLIAWGAVNRPFLFMNREYWRLFTAAFLHIGLEHLVMNGLSLWFVGRAVEALFGRWRMVLIYLVAAVAGSVASTVLGPPIVVGAGASGAVFGLVGAIIWFRISSPMRHRIAWRPLLVTLVLNLGLGLALYHYIDNWNHLGGLVGGMVAAFAVGAPTVEGLALPRFRLPGPARWVAALALLALSVAPVAGYVELPGRGRDLARAMEALEDGRYAQAEQGLRRAVASMPDNPYLRYLLTHALYQQGKCREAQGELNYLLAMEPRDPDVLQLKDAIRACLH